MALLRLVLLLAVAILASFRPSAAEIRVTEVRSDGRTIIPFDEFGFTHNGVLELNVSGISFSDPSPALDLSQLGFFLSTRDAWIHVLQQLQERDITCPLGSSLVKHVYSLNQLNNPNPNPSGLSIPRSTFFGTVFSQSDPGQYTLVFANCLRGLRVSMTVRSAMYNLDPHTGHRAYLSAGAASLPLIYFLLFLAYAALAAAWVAVLLRKRSAVFRIHYFMLAVVVLKALNLLCEAEDKSYIERTGSAHGWDVLFYIFSFLKGISLFTLIVLIGTGWSFLKPYLQEREKKVLMVVIPLQVVANIAQVAIDESSPYARDWVNWKQVFLLVDVVCCCAVLFPIVWSIKNLREAARTDGKAAVNLMKLTLFRQYYVVVICYIYFTRVVVYAFVTITSYRYLWTSVVAGELATLAFYIFTGYKFKPEVHNPYFVIDDEEEEAAAEALKLDDEFEL
ncbi:protein CANDIDATE G-PROTEIN COUPLED RECEPTOR 7-like [Phoenix dactylifera]|uniref:Protein CANDIDATE G-PROTEIN COUPLED RECEPTOR 7-like n=1 Tax=Phoenix dactylifera TaxID=42345 RepID=A0A8B8ZTX5_PHODC|nr:protein CANDIDATE G-PROTEIN COUPLED RECEPTOR 7-like [Phoenix dactylifera]